MYDRATRAAAARDQVAAIQREMPGNERELVGVASAGITRHDAGDDAFVLDYPRHLVGADQERTRERRQDVVVLDRTTRRWIDQIVVLPAPARLITRIRDSDRPGQAISAGLRAGEVEGDSETVRRGHGP